MITLTCWCLYLTGENSIHTRQRPWSRYTGKLTINSGFTQLQSIACNHLPHLPTKFRTLNKQSVPPHQAQDTRFPYPQFCSINHKRLKQLHDHWSFTNCELIPSEAVKTTVIKPLMKKYISDNATLKNYKSSKIIAKVFFLQLNNLQTPKYPSGFWTVPN